jgi:tRNA G18 (ribose-2'-O)-methylase SpoU
MVYFVFVALTPPLDASPEEVKDALAPLRGDFSVAVYAAGNAFALGAIVRVAHNFLAREVIVIGDEPAYEKASMGMEKFESIVRLADEAAFFMHVGSRPVWALEKDAARRSITSVVEFPRDVVFLFGSERFGVPAAVLAKCNDVIGIAIYGVNHSLPLAVAAGIVMHEHARRRFAPGTLL